MLSVARWAIVIGVAALVGFIGWALLKVTGDDGRD